MASILIFYGPKHKNATTKLLKSNVPLKVAKKFCNLSKTHNRSEEWFCGFMNDDDTGHQEYDNEELRQKLLTILTKVKA
jgi:hypothetical protein